MSLNLASGTALPSESGAHIHAKRIVSFFPSLVLRIHVSPSNAIEEILVKVEGILSSDGDFDEQGKIKRIQTHELIERLK